MDRGWTHGDETERGCASTHAGSVVVAAMRVSFPTLPQLNMRGKVRVHNGGRISFSYVNLTPTILACSAASSSIRSDSRSIPDVAPGSICGEGEHKLKRKKNELTTHNCK